MRRYGFCRYMRTKGTNEPKGTIARPTLRLAENSTSLPSFVYFRVKTEHGVLDSLLLVFFLFFFIVISVLWAAVGSVEGKCAATV